MDWIKVATPRMIREKLGMSQAQLSATLGVSVRAVGVWESLTRPRKPMLAHREKLENLARKRCKG